MGCLSWLVIIPELLYGDRLTVYVNKVRNQRRSVFTLHVRALVVYIHFDCPQTVSLARVTVCVALAEPLLACGTPAPMDPASPHIVVGNSLTAFQFLLRTCVVPVKIQLVTLYGERATAIFSCREFRTPSLQPVGTCVFDP